MMGDGAFSINPASDAKDQEFDPHLEQKFNSNRSVSWCLKNVFKYDIFNSVV